jgi:hypothetical protein
MEKRGVTENEAEAPPRTEGEKEAQAEGCCGDDLASRAADTVKEASGEAAKKGC